MTGLVIDASSALAWCFDDEGGAEADALIDKVLAEGAVVPGLWFLEVANGLVSGERRGGIKRAESSAFVAMIEELPIEADPATGIALCMRRSASRATIGSRRMMPPISSWQCASICRSRPAIAALPRRQRASASS